MFAAILLCFALLSFGQEDTQGRRPAPPPTPTPMTVLNPAPTASPSAAPSGQARVPQERPSPSPEELPVITHHEIRAGGRTLRYTATVGMMPIKNRDGETEARIFFMAYTLDEAGNRGRRPLTFSFNGGPGSASVCVHPGWCGLTRTRGLAPRLAPLAPTALHAIATPAAPLRAQLCR